MRYKFCILLAIILLVSIGNVNALEDSSQWSKRYDLVPIIPWATDSWDKENGGPEVAFANGVWYGYYIGKLDEKTSGKGRKIGLATSTDGVSWDRYSGNPIIEFEGTVRDSDFGIIGPAIGRNPDGTPALLDGKWVIVFGNYDGVDSTVQWATSTDGKNWAERGETGIMNGPPDSADTGEAFSSSLIRDFDGTWYMFYYGGGPTRTIGVAFGPSPKQLTPYSGNPILKPDLESWDKKMVDRPKVTWDADSGKWIMAYSGRDGYPTSNGIGLANSSDLLNWTKIGRIIDHGDPGSSDSTAIWVTGLTRNATEKQVIWRIYYEAFGDSSTIGPNGYDGFYGGHMAETVLNLDDTTPPAVEHVTASDPNKVEVFFLEAVEEYSATDISNYAIDNGITIYSASIGSDLKTVTLTTSTHVEGIDYTITISNVRDRASTPNTMAPTEVTYKFINELTITNIIAASGKNYVLDLLDDTGKLQYIDRDYTFDSVPSSYADLKYIRTANDDKASTGSTFLEFDVNQDVTVYVAHDDRISPKPSWLASFTDTGDDLVGRGGTFSIYAIDFSAGHISLGGNSGDNYSMYNVVLKPLTNSTFVSNPPDFVNSPPEFGVIGDKIVNEGQTLIFAISATDADGDVLTYSTTNLPTGATFNSTTCAFSWKPADGQAGTYVFTFEVTDGHLSDSEAVTIAVNEGNHALVITAFEPADSSVFNEADIITIDVIASDSDGHALTYSIKIDGVTKSTTSSYAWETDYSSAGAHTIDVTVSDGIDQVIDQHIITVNNIYPRWDVNEDGKVDILDITIIGQNIGTSVEAPYPRWDVNQDSFVNIQDLSITAYYFGETVS